MTEDVRLCLLPHHRVGDDGEAVWDYEVKREGANGGSFYLCEGHLGALRVHLETLGALALHCRRLITPSASAGLTGGRSGAVDAPAPLALSPVDDADDILAWMWSWASMIAEDTGHRLPPQADAWACGGVVHGMRRGDYVALVALTGWLLDRLDAAARRPWIDEWALESKVKAAQLDRRYPRSERPIFLPMPCPACDLLTLVRHPPRFRDLPVLIVCDSHDCGEVLPENMYDWYTRRFAEEKRT